MNESTVSQSITCISQSFVQPTVLLKRVSTE